MTLLTSMFERPLDPGYAAAAAQRAAAGLPPATSMRSPLIVAFSLLLGITLGLASAVLRGNETARGKARANLISQIESQRATIEAGSKRAAALQGEVTLLEEQSLAAIDGDVAALRELGQVSGAVPLTGPGITVQLDDSPAAQERTRTGGARVDAGAQDYVMSRDLQIVVNNLWECGAEAISINGQRLTSLSAIRFAGQAILVDYRPLIRPYTVSAIGDPVSLRTRFDAGTGGAYLNALSSNFGVLTSVENRDSLTLPGAATLQLRYAVPATSPSPGGSP